MTEEDSKEEKVRSEYEPKVASEEVVYSDGTVERNGPAFEDEEDG